MIKNVLNCLLILLFRRLAVYIHLRAYKDSEIWEERRKLLPHRSSKSSGGWSPRRELETTAKRKRSKRSYDWMVEKANKQNETDAAMFLKFRTKEGWYPADSDINTLKNSKQTI